MSTAVSTGLAEASSLSNLGAQRTSADRPADSTNGDSSSGLDDDQTLADREQTLAGVDQMQSDLDQTAADSDQAAADGDQEASDQYRAAAQQDRELASRDAARTVEAVEPAAAEILRRATENRARATADAVTAAEGRSRAAADRAQAARDREQSARDRLQAQVDREELLRQLAVAETDVLTGACTRGPGLADLNHEIDRARRTTGLLVVAYVDVVDLKGVNDAQGHAAGDDMLQRVVRTIRTHLRSYDLIIRLGGDEFLCVLSGSTAEDARERFDAVQATLASPSEPFELGRLPCSARPTAPRS
jgi:diguanylate cyclase (GGDEF)-like protein